MVDYVAKRTEVRVPLIGWGLIGRARFVSGGRMTITMVTTVTYVATVLAAQSPVKTQAPASDCPGGSENVAPSACREPTPGPSGHQHWGGGRLSQGTHDVDLENMTNAARSGRDVQNVFANRQESTYFEEFSPRTFTGNSRIKAATFRKIDSSLIFRAARVQFPTVFMPVDAIAFSRNFS